MKKFNIFSTDIPTRHYALWLGALSLASAAYILLSIPLFEQFIPTDRVASSPMYLPKLILFSSFVIVPVGGFILLALSRGVNRKLKIVLLAIPLLGLAYYALLYVAQIPFDYAPFSWLVVPLMGIWVEGAYLMTLNHLLMKISKHTKTRAILLIFLWTVISMVFASIGSLS